MGPVAKSNMRKGFLKYDEIRRYLNIYEEAGMTLQPIPSESPYISGKFCFLFYQCTLN